MAAQLFCGATAVEAEMSLQSSFHDALFRVVHTGSVLKQFNIRQTLLMLASILTNVMYVC